VAAGADLGLQVVQAGHVDQADGLGAPIGEGVACRVFEVRSAAGFVAEVARQEIAQRFAPLRTQGIRRDLRTVRRPQRQCAGARLEEGRQFRGLGVAGKAHEIGFRQPDRLRRVEARVALRQREDSVPRNGVAGLDDCFLQRLGRQAFDREAVEIFDAHGTVPP
jgi:hypothetical protein